MAHSRSLGFDAEGHSPDDEDLMFRTTNSLRVRLNLPELDLINPSR